MRVLIYLALLSTCCLYAAIRGGAPERWGVAILLSAVVASALVPVTGGVRFGWIEWGLLLVDGAMFVAILILALHAQRYWPIWMAAILLNTVITHLLMLAPSLMPWSYHFAMAAWSYPNPVLLAAGAWRHRDRIRRFGSDPAWSR